MTNTNTITGNSRAYGFIAACAWLLCFYYSAPILLSLWGSWQVDEYSHGFIIPIIAILVGMHALDESKPAASPSWWGVAILFLAALLMLAGELSAFEPLQHYALLATLMGLVLAFWGRAVMIVLLPSFAYLLFCIPLPRLIFVALSQKLQLWSSMFGVWIIERFSIPVYREGNIIDLGVSKLQVVEACGGLRYLFPLMSFGFLVALLLKDSFWKRAFIFISSVPITIGINSLRIAIIGITVHYWGIGMAEGLTHDMEGWTLFLLCLLILGGETWVLMRIGNRGHFRFEYMTLPSLPHLQGAMKLSAPMLAALVIQISVALTSLSGWVDNREEILPSHPPFVSFPLQLDQWKGRQGMIDNVVLSELKVSDYWIADYRMADNIPPVNLYMAYYASQRIGTSAHSPANCIPGSGWQVEANHLLTLASPALTLSRMVIAQGKDRQLVYYWFDERGRILTEQYSAKWYLLWDSITRHRSDGAMIRLVTTIARGETEAQADARLQGFLKFVYPEVKRFIPE